jgi:predicted nucleotidyltransferase component of viral defense system
MNRKSLTNISASIRQRLLNKARTEHRTLNELLQYYAMERFLYRLSISAHADRFVLKGALMLRVWRSPETRPTMDIDMLGRTSNRDSDIIAQFEDILSVNVEPDGLVFDPQTIRTEHITEDADYEGVRVRFQGTLDSARINMQIDIGFGDVVLPEPEIAELPTILDYPVPRLLCYSRESAIAEKFEAMVKRRELNSRMKDFYDIWLLSRQFNFDGTILSEAIKQTLKQRGTDLPDDIVAFSEQFMAEKQVQWTAFRKRLRLDGVPSDFSEVISAVKDFLAPIADSIRYGSLFTGRWTVSGRWT